MGGGGGHEGESAGGGGGPGARGHQGEAEGEGGADPKREHLRISYNHSSTQVRSSTTPGIHMATSIKAQKKGQILMCVCTVHLCVCVYVAVTAGTRPSPPPRLGDGNQGPDRGRGGGRACPRPGRTSQAAERAGGRRPGQRSEVSHEGRRHLFESGVLCSMSTVFSTGIQVPQGHPFLQGHHSAPCCQGGLPAVDRWSDCQGELMSISTVVGLRQNVHTSKDVFDRNDFASAM